MKREEEPQRNREGMEVIPILNMDKGLFQNTRSI